MGDSSLDCFTWLLLKVGVLTHESLNSIGIHLCFRWVICGEQAETVNHLILHCMWKNQLWKYSFI